MATYAIPSNNSTCQVNHRSAISNHRQQVHQMFASEFAKNRIVIIRNPDEEKIRKLEESVWNMDGKAVVKALVAFAFVSWFYFAFVPSISPYMARQFKGSTLGIVEATRLLYGFNWRGVFFYAIVPISLTCGLVAFIQELRDKNGMDDAFASMIVWSLMPMIMIGGLPLAALMLTILALLCIGVFFSPAGPLFIGMLIGGKETALLIPIGIFCFIVFSIIFVPFIAHLF